MEPIPSPSVTLLPPPAIVPTHHGPLVASFKPKYFQNPWTSYRPASLNDAWEAYQKGAAVALSRAKTPKSIATPEDELLVPKSKEVLRTQSKSWITKGAYVPLKFSLISDEDHEDDWRDPPVEVVRPRWGGVELGNERETVTWLGHAGAMVQIPWRGEGQREGMCGVVFDPIFSYRCSPSQYVGPARYLDPPCQIAMLPDIHVCCISHDHYDHLDYYSIMDIWNGHRSTVHFLVPLGLKQWFTACGIPSERVTELDWYHEALLSFPPPSSDGDAGPALHMKVAFTPAQHRSGRGLLDHMSTLWGSWTLGVVDPADEAQCAERGMRDWTGFKVFFGGDTGYRYASAPEGDLTAVCPAFHDIAALYSPFDLSLLPLSTGSSLPFLRNLLSLSLDQYTLTSSLHCSPADSIDIHRILRSKRSLGIHWGTFCDEDEARGTRVEFGRARREKGVGKEWRGEEVGFVISEIGETLVIPRDEE
ncbi:N-acyl-phosphatidylethanolamine-hydrolyzing phospholipase D, partial [Tremellales sp. Uapishka_1]